jgi:ElaB/YqjD/DUF883 family membrane-anchored ribosome-binding protein
MTPFATPGTPDDAVWVFEQEDDEEATPNVEFEAATEVFAHETAAESAEVFEEVGQTAGEAATAFTPSLADRVVNAAGPAIAAVVTRIAPVVAKGAEALGPVVARAEAVAKPVIDKAEEVAKPFIDKAEELIAPVMSNAGPYVEKAQHAVSDLADVVAGKADEAAAAFDTAADRIKDTAVGMVAVAKPVARDLAEKVKVTVAERLKK